MRATKAGNTSKKRHGGLVQTVSSHREREREREKAFVKAMKAGNTSKKRHGGLVQTVSSHRERERERESLCESYEGREYIEEETWWAGPNS